MAMAQGGGSSILDSLLEIVDSVTPSEDSYTISFTFDKGEGHYFIVSDPPGNYETASGQSQSQILNATALQVRGLTSKSYSGSSIAIRKTPTTSNAIDWWTPTITETSDGITIDLMAGRYKAVAGVTYYLLRVKGM